MPRHRICVAAPQVPYLSGGAELHTDLLVAALREEGHDVELINQYQYDSRPVGLLKVAAVVSGGNLSRLDVRELP